MRAPLIAWPRGREWLAGLAISAPLAWALWSQHSASEELRTTLAAIAVLLALPWVVPGMVLVAALSAPVYMWLHTRGPTPPVLEWLGGTVLIGAVIGAHINAALAWIWLRRGRARAEPGLGEYLKRADRTIDDARV